MLRDFKTRKVNYTMIKFLLRRKIRKLYKDNGKGDYRSYMHQLE